MTDAEIEAIARAYCRKLGLDPDERVGLLGVQWNYLERFVRNATSPAMQEAIAEVRGEKGGGG